MNFNILISGGLYTTQSAYSALQFCRAAVAGGQKITQVFFYQDGVSNGTSLSVPLGDEFDTVEEWVSFSREQQIPLIVCVSAAERRGLLNDEQAAEFARVTSNLHPQFSVAGLGALHQASLESDRTVSFK